MDRPQFAEQLEKDGYHKLAVAVRECIETNSECELCEFMMEDMEDEQ